MKVYIGEREGGGVEVLRAMSCKRWVATQNAVIAFNVLAALLA